MLTVHQQRTKLYPKRNFMNEILFNADSSPTENKILFITHADSSPTENKTISKA